MPNGWTFTAWRWSFWPWFSRPDKARFLAIARGSATECAAILDVVRIRGLAPVSDCLAGRTLLVRIVQMLTKLAARHSGLAYGPVLHPTRMPSGEERSMRVR
jgi:23S rRNA-intervening sequence protein